MRTLIAALLLLIAPCVRASTLGLLRCTNDGPQWRSQKTQAGVTGPRVLRDQESFAALWHRLALPGQPPPVDFAHDMILVLANTAREDRVIYRVQLDDGARPRALEVHVAGAALPCAGAETPAKAAVHVVQTRRSLLPVRFLSDAMIDGRLFVSGFSREGVEELELAVVAPPPGPIPSESVLPITTREGAEQRVVAALTATERKQLARARSRITRSSASRTAGRRSP